MSEKTKGRKRGESLTNGQERSNRVEVTKTYKLYIGGLFPRTESGRYLTISGKNGRKVNICQASRKDFRNAVVTARAAMGNWESRSAYNRSQILYRIAEMLEARKTQFVSGLINSGLSSEQASLDVEDAIDCIIHYAGWCDKYIQIFSTVNPVSSAHFNFSIPEPVGVVGIIGEGIKSLYGLVSTLMPVLTGANTAVLLVTASNAVLALDFAEVLETSDVPGGVVNILTGKTDELLTQFGSHLDLNAVIAVGLDRLHSRDLEVLGAAHVLRVIHRSPGGQVHGPYPIMDTQEIKTTWHPVGT